MRLESRVRIHRPIGEVFEFVSSPEHLPLWASGVAGAERSHPGPIGLGATFELLQDGRTDKDCWEVIEHEPPRTFAYRRLDWSAFSQARYTLHCLDGWTGLGLEVYRCVGTSREPPPLLKQSAQRQLESDLGRLHDLLESGVSEEEMREGDAADNQRRAQADEETMLQIGSIAPSDSASARS